MGCPFIVAKLRPSPGLENPKGPVSSPVEIAEARPRSAASSVYVKWHVRLANCHKPHAFQQGAALYGNIPRGKQILPNEPTQSFWRSAHMPIAGVC